MSNRTRTDALLIAGFCAFLFFYGAGQFGLIGADEPRYAQVAREMLEKHEWVTPILNHEPWLEKPPLYYWEAMLAYTAFGVSDSAARLPSGFNATLLALGTYFFFRRFRKNVEADAALITASCAGLVGYARAASMDMALASTFTIGMLAWWGWRESGKKIYLAAFYAFIALGTLAKGPIAPFLAAAVIVVYAIAARELRVVGKMLWIPGILLFFAIALPWYVAVQMRNPEFFRIFILEHNLGRFSKDLYHHREPFWYYLPVTAIALVPWIVFVATSLARIMRVWWAEFAGGPRKPSVGETDFEFRLNVFAACWLIVPVVFFSISQSKLPGYILPAIPAGAILLADSLRRSLLDAENVPVSKWLTVLHAVAASAWIVPALLIAYLATQHRLPGGRPLYTALAIALVLCGAIVFTLVRQQGLRMLRFVTLIPVMLAIYATLKLGAPALDQTITARPLAHEIASVETRPITLAVYGVSRELEYGLTFYRNQVTKRYEWGTVPPEEHLLVTPEHWQTEIAKQVNGRRVAFLGHYEAQRLDYYWVAAANNTR